MCEQQIEGGMGIGTILYEELRYKHGRLLNPDFKDYKIPTAAEIPSGKSIASFIVKCPHKERPYGAKGFAEVVLVPVALAIGNALYNAIGVRLYGMPLIPEKVFEAIFEEECQQRGIRLFVLPPRLPKLNGAVERAHRTHTEEFYEVTESSFGLSDLREELLEWERVYNTIRPHQALGYGAPLKFLRQRKEYSGKEVMCH